MDAANARRFLSGRLKALIGSVAIGAKGLSLPPLPPRVPVPFYLAGWYLSQWGTRVVVPYLPLHSRPQYDGVIKIVRPAVSLLLDVWDVV